MAGLPPLLLLLPRLPSPPPPPSTPPRLSLPRPPTPQSSLRGRRLAVPKQLAERQPTSPAVEQDPVGQEQGQRNPERGQRSEVAPGGHGGNAGLVWWAGAGRAGRLGWPHYHPGERQCLPLATPEHAQPTWQTPGAGGGGRANKGQGLLASGTLERNLEAQDRNPQVGDLRAQTSESRSPESGARFERETGLAARPSSAPTASR